MKFFTALGGFIGFAFVIGIGLFTGRHSAMLLLQASVACMVGALLFRWWHRLLLQGVQSSLQEKRVAAAAARRAEAATASNRAAASGSR